MAKPFDWARALKTASAIAEGVLAGSGLSRDWPVAKAAAVNLLLAGGFPLPAAMKAWGIGRGAYVERINRVLADPDVRVWLLEWADAPRELRRRSRAH